MSERAELVLGWRTNPSLEPAYWVEGLAKAGLQTFDDLVRVPADTIAGHTAIVAQSGSGKSFFLGRLVEEIVIRTRARCVILDPNTDFRRVHEIEGASLWTTAAYDRQRRRGQPPHEKSKTEFSRLWRRKDIRIRTASRAMRTSPYESLQVSWPLLSMDVLAEDLDPMLRSDLYHCHTFVQDLARLHQMKDATPTKTRDLIDEAEHLLRQARTSENDIRASLKLTYDADDIVRPSSKGTPPYVNALLWAPPGEYVPKAIMEWIRSTARTQITSLIETLARTPKYVSPAVEHFYFSQARNYEAAGVITAEVQPPHAALLPDKRLEVIDLPSLRDHATRLLAINAIMTAEWNTARDRWAMALLRPTGRDYRVPTFIVIDEAHNLIPAEPRTQAAAAVRELFRTIVAEGRKYGLFVVLVSQRPDKLDPLVLSECENKAIMKLSSGSVRDITRALLGLDDVHPKMLDKCLEFDVGRALLIGRWSPAGPQFLYSAARRTVEGGRNLREDYWAAPIEIPPVTRRAASHRPKRRRSRQLRAERTALRLGGRAKRQPKPGRHR